MSAEGGERDLPVPARPAPAGSLVRRVVGALVPRRVRLRGTVYLLLDHSTSMGDAGKMDQLRRGALRFFLEAVRRDYAVGVVGFADRARVVLGAGRNVHRFWRRLDRLEPYGRTAMAAGLTVGTRRLAPRAGRRVLILITDGKPDDRAATLAAAQRARAQDVRLITIGTDGADHDFLRTLTGRPELARRTRDAELERAVADAAADLDGR